MGDDELEPFESDLKNEAEEKDMPDDFKESEDDEEDTDSEKKDPKKEAESKSSSSQGTKSTIYVAIPVKENKKVKCPHCNTRVKLARRDTILTCPECFEYMHVVYIKKGDASTTSSKRSII